MRSNALHGFAIARFHTSVPALVLLALLVLGPCTGHGETFTVSSASELQSRLNTAAGNGEDDVINITAGPYLTSTTLVFDSVEAFDLRITGAGIGVTILDGGNPAHHQVLSLRSVAAGASLTLEKLTIRDGLSTSAIGGALAMETGTGAIAVTSCEISDSSVTGTDDQTIGGGAAITSISGDITVTGSSFLRNHSEANVGGLFATTGGTILLEDSLFEDNTVDNLGGSVYYGDGGGAQLYGGDGQNGQVATVRRCTFRNNSAAGGDNPDGGGLMIYQNGADVSAEVVGSTFTGNQADLGGAGLFIRINDSGDVTLSHNELTGNITTSGGGAGAQVHLNNGNLMMVGNSFAGNEAGNSGGGSGGGMDLNHVQGNASITDNLFVDNSAAENGGGLQLFGESAVITLAFNIFEGNTCGNVGAGLSYSTTGGTLNLSSSSFANNTAGVEGGGLYVYLDQATAPLSVANLILWGDAPDEVGHSTGTGATPLTIRSSDIQGGSSDSWFGTGCIDADPLFVDAAGGDLHLSWSSYPADDAGKSPCIDSGEPPDDPDGTPADMGALPWGSLFADGFESASTSSWSSST